MEKFINPFMILIYPSSLEKNYDNSKGHFDFFSLASLMGQT